MTSAPPVPEPAREVFGARWPLASTYAEMLATDGVTRGLIGPREAPRIWERHLLNCAVLTDAVERDADVCDIGSGAGLPGLVIAIRRPDLRVTLVEPLLRRATFLSEAVERLGLERVEVVRARAEDLHGSAGFSVVTSRAVAPLPRLLAWSLPLLQPGGDDARDEGHLRPGGAVEGAGGPGAVAGRGGRGAGAGCTAKSVHRPR